MKISVILPSLLAGYEGCATDRKKKFRRAVNSYLSQTYQDKELIIISDGCAETVNLVNNFYQQSHIHLIQIEKQPLFSGNVRQAGINVAKGEIITYLDSDDFFGGYHLNSISEGIGESNWIYYNDFIYYGEGNPYEVREVKIEHGSVGTSSISHKKSMGVSWENCNDFGHDWLFIKKLIKESDNYGKIYGCQYFVAHMKNRTDF